jgi:hypothetical protein
MKKIKTICVMLLSLAATIAVAKDDDHRRCRGDDDRKDDDRKCVAAVAAPEIDPAQGLSAVILLAGTVAILGASRARKK